MMGYPFSCIEQNAPLSLSIANRAYVLHDGKIVYSGAAVDLSTDTELVNRLCGRRLQDHNAKISVNMS